MCPLYLLVPWIYAFKLCMIYFESEAMFPGIRSADLSLFVFLDLWKYNLFLLKLYVKSDVAAGVQQEQKLLLT